MPPQYLTTMLYESSFFSMNVVPPSSSPYKIETAKPIPNQVVLFVCAAEMYPDSSRHIL